MVVEIPCGYCLPRGHRVLEPDVQSFRAVGGKDVLEGGDVIELVREACPRSVLGDLLSVPDALVYR